jgi:hypothetical protein
VKRLSWIALAAILFAGTPALAGSITLKEGGRRLFGTIISRPDSSTGTAVVTVSSLSDMQVYQFGINEVARIESATGEVRILKAPAAVRAGTSEDAEIIRRFTEGMEFQTGETSGGWVSVTPAAQGLAQDKGWLPANLLVRRLEIKPAPPEESSDSEGAEGEAGGNPDPGE